MQAPMTPQPQSTEQQQPEMISLDTMSYQLRQFMSNYNHVSTMCFDDCIHDFTGRKLLEKESTCTLNCMQKYLNMTQRIQQRFRECHIGELPMGAENWKQFGGMAPPQPPPTGGSTSK